MLRVAVCDDEQIIRSEIIKSADEYSILRSIDIVCDEYATGIDLLSSPVTYDMLLLDHYLGADAATNGLEIARAYRQKDACAAIVFLSRHQEIACDAYEVSTFRFLIKPFDKQAFFRTLDNYQKSLETDRALMIRLDGSTHIIYMRRILFLEGSGRYCTIHTLDTTLPIECHETLAKVESRLPAACFFRCHRSFIVNLYHVKSYTHKQVVLDNGACVDISKSRYDGFVSALTGFIKKYKF